MTLQSIKFTAGINSDITNLSNQGGFIDGNKMAEQIQTHINTKTVVTF